MDNAFVENSQSENKNFMSGVCTKIYGASIGIDVSTQMDAMEALNKGLSVASFDMLRDKLDVSNEVLAKACDIPISTLYRRKEKGEKLDKTESDRLFRIAKLYEMAKDLMHDDEVVQLWFKSPKKIFNKQTPLTVANNEIGVTEVENLLGRIEHGVYL